MKYEIISTQENKQFLLDCPIQLVKSMITREVASDIYYLNLKYFSMADKDISSVCVKIVVKTKGAIKVNSNYIFKPKTAKGMIQNEAPHPFHMGEYSGAEILVTKILFSDGSVWVGATTKPLVVQVPEKIDIAGFEKYRYQIDKKYPHINAKYAFSETEYLWRCPCGCVNQNKKCFACGGDRLDTRNFFDIERLERQQGWIEEMFACKEEMQPTLETLEETKRLSAIFDSQINNSKSQNSKTLAKVIETINEIYNEPNFLKKAQADEILARAKARFKARKQAEVENKLWMVSIQNNLAETKRKKVEKTAKQRRMATVLSSITAVVLLISISTFYALTNIVIPDWKYTSGMESFNNGDYTTAISVFAELGEYQDSQELITESWYRMGEDFIYKGEYNNARNVFLTLGEYKETTSYLKRADKMEGEDYLAQSRYQDALDMFALVGDMDGVQLMKDQCYYGMAIDALNAENDDLALEMFLLSNNYANTNDFIYGIISEKAESFFVSGDYKNLIELLDGRTEDFVSGYLSAVVPEFESNARLYYENGDYITAKDMYLTLANMGEYLSESAGNRVVAYPVYCDARLYGNNYSKLVEVFDLTYESFQVVQEVNGYMVKFLEGGKWVDTGGASRSLTVEPSGYAIVSVPSLTTVKGMLSYNDGYVYIDGDKYAEMKVTSYSSIVFSTGKGEDAKQHIYARTNG